MSAIFVSVTLAASGVPQQLSRATSPALPSITVGGVVYPSGSATQQLAHIGVQAAPGNTGNVFVGGAAINKATLSNVGLVLIPGAFASLGQYGGFTTLDDLWADTATSGNILLLTLIG